MTVPSGGDPLGYALDNIDGVLFGASTGGISGMKDLSQATVQAAKLAAIVGNEVLTTILELVFDGLRNGVSLALAIIESIAVKLFGLIPGFSTVTEALNSLLEVPVLHDLIQALTGVVGGTYSDLTTWATTIGEGVADLAALIIGLGGTTIADVVTIITNIGSGLTNIINILWGIFNGTSGATGKTATDVASIGATFATSVTTLITNFQTLLNHLFDGFTGALGSTGKSLADVLAATQAFFTGAAGAATKLGTLISGLGAAAWADVVALLQVIVNGWQAVLNALHLSTPTALVQQIPQSIPALVRDIEGGLSAVGGGLIRDAEGAIHYVEDGLTHLVQQADQAILSLPQIAQQILHAANTISAGTAPSAAAVANPGVADVVAVGQVTHTALTSAIEQAGATVENDIVAGATQLGGAVQTAGTNALGVIQGVNNAAAGVLSGASAALADAETNLQALLTGPAQFLQGLFGVFGQSATNDAYAAAAAARAAQAAEQTRINSAFNAVFNVNPTTAGNVSQTVDFSPLANASTMTGVMSPGTTNMGITSGAAARQVGTTGQDTEVFPTQTVTDYQVISYTLGPLNDLASGQVITYLIGRVNSARDTFVYVVIISGQVGLGAFVSGVPTGLVAAVVVPTMSSGGTVKLILGDPSSSSPYAMQVLYNGTPVITYTDGSHISQLGSSYRYVGLSMQSATAGKYPPAIRTVTYQDNPPASGSFPFSGRPTAGTQGRFYLPDDVGRIDLDTGSAWRNIWAGPLAQLTTPPSTGWSWVNQGGASNATELGGEQVTAPTSTRNWRLRTRTLTPASNYAAGAYVEAAGASASTWWSGIGLRNSSSGSLITFGPYMDSTAARLAVTRWTDSTTFSATSAQPFVYQLAGGVMPNWLRIRDDGSNRYFDYSVNGVDWILVFSEGRTAFITPDQFCAGADNEGSGADLTIRLRSLAGIS